MTERLLTRELRSYAVSRMWFMLAKLLVEVFVPLMLLKHGYHLVDIFLYNLMTCVVVIPACYAAGWVVTRYGQRPAFAYAYIGAAWVQVLIASILHGPASPSALVSLALATGIASGFNQVSSLIHLVANVSDHRPGRDNASLQVFTQTVGFFGPLLGAVIGAKLGPGWIWPVACLFLTLALYQVRYVDGDYGRGHSLRLRGVVPVRDQIASASVQVHSVVGMLVWPIYLAVITPSYQSIGLIAAIAGGVNVLALWWTGRRFDDGQGWRILTETVLAIAGINIARVFWHNYLQLAAISAVYAVVFNIFWTTWLGAYQRLSRQAGLAYVVMMEISGAFGGIAVWGGLALLAALGTTPGPLFAAAFFVAAIGALGCLLLRRG